MRFRLSIVLLTAVACCAQSHPKVVAASAKKSAATPSSPAEIAGWPGYGGPTRNFVVPDAGLANQWPATGPKVLWKHELGDGYSGISEHNGKLFTMFRRDGHHEVIAALNAADGKVVWQYPFESGSIGDKDLSYGPGPHVEPQVVDGRVFAVGIAGKMFCLDGQTGKVIWQHDLVADFGAESMGRGYGNNPLPYKNTILLPIGGAHAMIALGQGDGKLVWQSKNSYKNGYAAPILIRVNGQEQAVFFMGNEIVGLDPSTGAELWKHAHSTEWGLNISMPVWMGGRYLFMSSAYNAGSRLLELERDINTTVKEKWFTNKLRIHIGDAIPWHDCIIGASGDFGPAFITAINVNTGQELWRDRSAGKADMVLAGDKLVLVYEDGSVALAKPDNSGLHVISRAELLNHNAWTAPTLVGTRLYLRDRQQVMAVDLK